MLSAEARLSVLESLDSACAGVTHTWAGLVNPRQYAQWGMAVGGGLLGVWMLRRLVKRGKRAVVTASTVPAAGGSSPLVYLLVQLASVFLLPMLRARMANSVGEGFWQRLQPSHLFFRWLGLEK